VSSVAYETLFAPRTSVGNLFQMLGRPTAALP